jgi:hypothetical protein
MPFGPSPLLIVRQKRAAEELTTRALPRDNCSGRLGLGCANEYRNATLGQAGGVRRLIDLERRARFARLDPPAT